MTKVNEYIESHWDECIKNNMTDEPRADGGILIGLPYPYTVPAVGHFNEIYYWDTYFTNCGLIRCGRAQLAKNNVDNMLYLVDKFGFMPNGNTDFFLSRSQPPFLSEMVKDVYDYYKDKVWLTGAYAALTKEYKFWVDNRTDQVGLSAYGGELDESNTKGLAKDLERRIGAENLSAFDELSRAKHSIGCCESGWDMNPRWGFECYNYYHVDLNSLLYQLESNMELFASELENGEQNMWAERKEKRCQLMNKFLVKDGLFLDYNHKTKEYSDVFSVASLYPMYAGLATKEQAQTMVDNLSKLEAQYGLLVCEQTDLPGNYQWGYPNGWACLQYVAVVGLLNYGYKEDAKRIAQKYVDLLERTFEETGNLWEKYNVIEGNVNVTDEYKMPPMMGWSAGIYLAMQNILNRG